MKTAIVAAVLLAAIAPAAASAESILSHAFSNPNEFSTFYSRTVEEMTKAGVAVQQACFTDGVRYCNNFMSWGSAKDGYLDAYSIHEANGLDLTEVCFGGDTARRCALSNGFIYDQTWNGKVWNNVRTVADGFAG